MLKALQRYKDYPYMYARVSAKRAKLLDERDYNDLIKMEPNQIAKRLEEGDYKREINELGAEYEGTELVELALNRNLTRTMQKLIEMAPEPLEGMIGVYLRRFDVLTLKRILRAKAGESEKEAKELLVPVNRYEFDELVELMERDYEEIVASIDFPDSEVDYQSYIDNTDLTEVESALDKAYSKELELLCEKTTSRQFRGFIRNEMEHENIMTALRLKKYDFGPEEIREHLINGTESSVLESVIEAENLEKAIKELSENRENGYPDRLEDVEQQLESERLQNALKMLHAEPLGATSILGYTVAKHAEVKNLRMLIRARETGVQNPETIRNNLVIP